MMNERIKELVKQVDPSFGENQKWAVVGEADIEKFAELIVKETIASLHYFMVDRPQWEAEELTRKHFGVES